jgi:hypothetical protein
MIVLEIQTLVSNRFGNSHFNFYLMIANKPVYRNPIFIILVAVLVLGGVVGIIGLAYHLNKSPTGNDDKPRNLGNKGKTEGEGGTENPLNNGSTEIGGGAKGKDKNSKSPINPKMDPQFVAAQDALNGFLSSNYSHGICKSFSSLTVSGTNGAILQFSNEYLALKEIEKDVKPQDILKKLDEYFKVVYDTSQADATLFYMRLRSHLASFSLEKIKVHQILSSLLKQLDDDPQISPKKSKIIILFECLYEPGKFDLKTRFQDLINELPSALPNLRNIFDTFFKPALESLLKAEESRLAFTPILDTEIKNRQNILNEGIRICSKWSNLIPLLLLESSNPHFPLAKKEFFDASKLNTRNFLRRTNSTDKENIDLALFKNYFEFDTPDNFNYFKGVAGELEIFLDESFPPGTEDAKKKFSSLS